MSALVVHLNGGELYDVEPAVPTFETAGRFEVELRNHGQPVHVHLRLDEGLSRVASLEGTNHYVEDGTLLRVPVDVVEGAPDVEGTLGVVTGYGKGTAEVSVAVTEDADGEDPRPVDEDLGTPEAGDRSDDRSPGLVERLRERMPEGRGAAILEAPAAVGAAALAVLALGGVGVAASLGSTIGVVAAIFVGLAAAGAAAYAMVR